MATPFVQTDEPEWAVPTIPDRDVPAELAALDQWVCWRRVTRNGKATKVPFRADLPEAEASTTDRSTWSSFASALAAAREPENRLDGVGFVFTKDDPYVGIDLDNALTADGAGIEPWAREVLDKVPGYAEVTPSGRGLHLIARGECPGGKGRRRGGFMPVGGGLEVYDRGRYFTVTGRVFEGRSEIGRGDRPFSEIHGELFPQKGQSRVAPAAPSPLAGDAEIVHKALDARNGDKFSRLWGGDRSGYPSPSEADLALCSCLTFYTQDASTIDRLFRQSGLASGKWADRPDYRELTIAKALERSEVYSPGREERAEEKRRENCENCKNGPEGDERGEGAPNKCNLNQSCSPSGVVTARAHEAAPESWPPPNLDGPRPAERFPLECLPGPMAEYARVAADCLGCPPDYVAAACLAVASGAAGRSVALKVKEGWTEVPCLYVALVGPPGTTKSPAVHTAARPLKEITRENLARYRREAELAKRAKQDLDATPQRIVVDDATVEALAGLLQENPRGLVMVKDELSALFSGLNQYKAGGKGNDRQFFLSAWSGSLVSVDRKHSPDRMPVHIPHPFLSVVGGMTPDMLGEMGDAKGRDDGFLDRLLFAAPERMIPAWTDEGIPDALALGWEHAVRRLWEVGMPPALDGSPRPFYVNWTADARPAYAAWYDAHNAEVTRDDTPTYLHGPWAKFRSYAARLALLLDRLELAFRDGQLEREPRDVGEEPLSRALVLTHYFKEHTRRVRAMMRGSFGDSPDARAVLRWARSAGKPTFKVAEARHNFGRRFPVDGPDLENALAWLTARHCIRLAVPAPARTGPGRKPSPEYEVNPALLGDMRGDD